MVPLSSYNLLRHSTRDGHAYAWMSEHAKLRICQQGLDLLCHMQSMKWKVNKFATLAIASVLALRLIDEKMDYCGVVDFKNIPTFSLALALRDGLLQKKKNSSIARITWSMPERKQSVPYSPPPSTLTWWRLRAGASLQFAPAHRSGHREGILDSLSSSASVAFFREEGDFPLVNL